MISPLVQNVGGFSPLPSVPSNMRSSIGIIKLGELSFYQYNVTMQLCEKGSFMFVI